MNIVRATGIAALLVCLLTKSAQADEAPRLSELISDPTPSVEQGQSISRHAAFDFVTSDRQRSRSIEAMALLEDETMRLHLDGSADQPYLGPGAERRSFAAVRLVMQVKF